MMNKRSRALTVLPLLVSMITMFLLGAIEVHATEYLEGELSITYSAATGKFTAVYDGEQSISGSAIYTWYKDGSTIGTGSTYAPSDAGNFYCTLRDPNFYDGILTSNNITLYRATGTNMSFDNTAGLYKNGDNVTVTANLLDNQVVTNWKTSATGVPIPESGQSVSFRMPAQNVTVTATIRTLYEIKVYGGTADKYTAHTGETITITASTVDGKDFVSWSASGGRLGDPKAETTTLTVASSSIVVTANFSGTVSSGSSDSGSKNSGRADALNTVYTVLNNQGHSVQMYHHTQGPLCDAAFRYAQGYDWLVTDYFNLTVDNSLSTYEIPNPLQIQVTIPDDLIQANRHWRMVCVSRNGAIYSFEDQDSNDSTITFSPNRFYAYAMCYNDIQPTVEEFIPEEPEPEPLEVKPSAPTSSIHSAGDSKTTASSIHSAEQSATNSGEGFAAAVTGTNTKVKSNQTSAVERADGAKVSLISM